MLKSEAMASLAEELPNWQVEQDDPEPRLVRTFNFDDFAEALAFTNKVGGAAEANDHHPQITLTWGSVKVEWWTHSEGGITNKDIDMAKTTDKLVSSS